MLLLEAKQYLEVDNNLLSYTVNGSGYPMILVHGLGTSIDSWSLNIKELSKYSKVYAIDLPGFGESSYSNEIMSSEQMADIIAQWCFKLKIKKAVFVGHSFGGEVCLWLTIKYPKLVKSLILAASTGLNDQASNIDRVRNMMIDGAREPLYFMPRLFKAYFKAGAWKMAVTLQRSHQQTISAYLSKIYCSVLIIYGSRDPVIIPEEDYNCVRQIKNAKVKIINSTHGLIFDSPEEFNYLVNDFIGSYN